MKYKGQREPMTCKWKIDNDIRAFTTECNHYFDLCIDVRCCPFCGKLIKVEE